MRVISTATCAAVAGLILLAGCSGKKADGEGNATATAAGGGEPAAAPAGGAGEGPKPGLWEISVSAAGMPQAVKTSVCVGEPAPGTNPFAPPPQPGQNCSKSNFTKTAGGYSIDMECSMNGMTVSTTGEVTGDFTSSYKTVMKTKVSGANVPAAAQAETTSTADAKYVGECPAGMKPGEAKQG